MHHRRSRTSRHEMKRYYSKSYRMSEKQTLNGGRPNTLAWEQKKRPLPDNDEPSNKGTPKKKKTPTKERCPANRTHEWYRELRTDTEPRYRYLWDSDLPGWKYYDEEVEYKVKTCIHCWKEIKVRAVPRSWRSYRKHLKKTLPKRKVKLY